MSDCGCGDGCCGGAHPVALTGMPRRDFVRTAAVGGVGMALRASGGPLGSIVAGPFQVQERTGHFVPADKKLSPAWVKALYARGDSTWYSGDELATIGMPVGGVCAGQVYLSGEGRLVDWHVFNENENTGYGATNYEVGRTADETVVDGKVEPSEPVAQGFAVRVRTGGRTLERTLDRKGFPGVRFCGEYPLARVEYGDPAFPVEVRLEAFSPFVPLDTDASTLPATVLRYTVRNAGSEKAEVTLAGWLENVSCLHHAVAYAEHFRRVNGAVAVAPMVGVVASAVEESTTRPHERTPIVLADFEGSGYGGWKAEGEAFGTHPAAGTLPDQNPVSGFEGKGLVNSYLGGDDAMGRLVSPTFTIERPWITFLVGGGDKPGTACMNLLVDGKVVRTATGKNTERLEPVSWDVKDLAGRRARLEIVDEAQGGWGHVNVDQIEMRDGPRVVDPGPVDLWPDHGTLCLATVQEHGGHAAVGKGEAQASVVPDGLPSSALDARRDRARKTAGEHLVGAVRRTLTVAPGAEAEAVFVVAWHMPNMYRDEKRVGNRYATRFSDAGAVAAHVAQHLDELTAATRLWHDTYYEGTLPHWLLDRMHSTVANLATTTAQWWDNGRFWAWEGAGCCRGTCGHVWNYEHALARLFPDLERSVREMQDFAAGVGFFPDSGAIGFRGEGWTSWAGDAQGGYVLKALREHQLAPDRSFLERNWPAIRKATEFLIGRDANSDGIIEGRQPQTYDEDFYGANTMVGSLYLGALRAAEEMAREMGDQAFAGECRRIFERGSRRSVQLMYNGEYYVQKVDLEEHPEWQYGDGCLSDHMFGQGWAHQVGLGYLYPPDTVRSSLASIWKYNWAPDVGPQNRAHDPERWFAYPGEAGLFTCTWPKGGRPRPHPTRYRNEIWTGIEYQVAGHMVWEGMLTEALALCRGVHERYHPSKHNPWNEIECGDHYARSMASWGVLVALAGFECHGPKAHLGFAPRITPEDFRCAYTAAEGWGSYAQKRTGTSQTHTVEVRRGSVPVRTLALAVPKGATLRDARATVGGSVVAATPTQDEQRVTLTLAQAVTLEAGSALTVELGW
jgi:non-lysosomal glucosylceramidase